MKRDSNKKILIENLGFDYYIVWEDEDLDLKIMELFNVIKTKLDG